MELYRTTTVTRKPSRVEEEVKVTSKTTETHQIIIIHWEHSNLAGINVELNSNPFKVSAEAHDSLMHYKLNLQLNLRYGIKSLDGTYFSVENDALQIHLPKKNLIVLPEKKVTLPRK